ncbi:IS5/IS1182 family transposase, partial [Aeromonas aquatilis]
KKKLTEVEVTVTPKAYLDELEQAIDEDREQHGKKPLRRRVKAAQSEQPVQPVQPVQSKSQAATPTGETRTIKQSTTDPDSGYMVREG